MSRSRKGKRHTAEWNQKIGRANRDKLKGRKLSEETKRKISEAQKGKVRFEMTDEIKQRISRSLSGYRHTIEAKRNMAVGIKDSWTRRGARPDSQTGIRGVSKRGDTSKYRVRVTQNGKRITLGTYQNMHDAEEVLRRWKEGQGSISQAK